MKKKYRALRTVAFVIQVLAWLVLVLAILGGIVALLAGIFNWVSIPVVEGFRGTGPTLIRVVTGIISALGVVIFGVISFIVLLAGAETIYTTLDIEQNTRLTADLLQRMLQPPPAPTPAPVPATPALLRPDIVSGETITQETPAV